jgi:hypothetical protein
MTVRSSLRGERWPLSQQWRRSTTVETVRSASASFCGLGVLYMGTIGGARRSNLEVIRRLATNGVPTTARECSTPLE